MIVINLDKMIIDDKGGIITYADMKKVHDYNINILGRLVKKYNSDVVVSSIEMYENLSLDKHNVINLSVDNDQYKALIDSINDYISCYVIDVDSIESFSTLSKYSAPITLNMFDAHFNHNFELIHNVVSNIEESLKLRDEYLEEIRETKKSHDDNDVKRSNDNLTDESTKSKDDELMAFVNSIYEAFVNAGDKNEITYAEKLYKVLDSTMKDVSKEEVMNLFDKKEITDKLINQMSALSIIMHKTSLIDAMTGMVITNAMNSKNFEYIDAILSQIEDKIDKMYDTIHTIENE